MDFYLTASNGGRIHFPINPEKITCEVGNKVLTFDVISLGEIPRPRGRVPVKYAFEGFFPGAIRRNSSYVKSWSSPKSLVDTLTSWLNKGVKMRLLVTETSISSEVYFDGSSGFRHEWQGGHGDCYYSIRLVEAREMMIQVDAPKATTTVAAAASATRPAPPAPKTYTVKSGDSLWAIAKQLLGDGSRWKEIYNANTGVIGSNPDLIYPGQVFRIP